MAKVIEIIDNSPEEAIKIREDILSSKNVKKRIVSELSLVDYEEYTSEDVPGKVYRKYPDFGLLEDKYPIVIGTFKEEVEF
jgi:hypothetical protein